MGGLARFCIPQAEGPFALTAKVGSEISLFSGVDDLSMSMTLARSPIRVLGMAFTFSGVDGLEVDAFDLGICNCF